MLNYLIYGMVFAGAALMVYNVIGFIRYAIYVNGRNKDKKQIRILYIPIILLVLFLLGYLAVGIFGKPDIIVSGILFGGSIFVFVMYILMFRITKRIAEQEKLEAEAQSNRAKMSFLSSVSHEMRTPLNVIIGLDTLALNDPEVSDKTRDHLEKIGLSANHLLSLINNILDMNKIETGEFIIKEEEFILSDAVKQINAIVQTLCDKKGLTYDVQTNKIPYGIYKGDEAMLKHVLIGILENAVKFTDAPGTVTFTVEKVPDTDNFKFVVKDTGVGMDAEFLPKLFTVFSQEDASSTNSGGSGISLAVIKSIIDLMGGSIDVQSEKNVGSAFTVTVPLKAADNRAGGYVSDNSLEGRRILIVEDLPENAEIVADLLELEGVVTEHAENGQIAVDMFEQSPFGYYDAILMDIRMPVMDGITATRRIRHSSHLDARTVPIVALSANSYQTDINASLVAGMNAHLAKPADANLLYTTLKNVIASSNHAAE